MIKWLTEMFYRDKDVIVETNVFEKDQQTAKVLDRIINDNKNEL